MHFFFKLWQIEIRLSLSCLMITAHWDDLVHGSSNFLHSSVSCFYWFDRMRNGCCHFSLYEAFRIYEYQNLMCFVSPLYADLACTVSLTEYRNKSYILAQKVSRNRSLYSDSDLLPAQTIGVVVVLQNCSVYLLLYYYTNRSLVTPCVSIGFHLLCHAVELAMSIRLC